MPGNIPDWLPDWLQRELQKPTMSVPAAGKAVVDAEPGQSYALARRGVIPTFDAGRRKEVPTAWVRRQLG